MKKILLIAAIIAAGASLQAQSLLFGNGSGQVGSNQFITDSDGTTRLSGSAFEAQLFTVGAGGSLTAQGNPVAFLTGAKSGLFNGGTVVTSVAGGTSATFEVGVWRVADGSFTAAQTAPGAHWGLSAPVTATVVNDSAVPTPPPTGLDGFKSFSLTANPSQVTPEPSTLALGALGLGALLLRRRLV